VSLRSDRRVLNTLLLAAETATQAIAVSELLRGRHAALQPLVANMSVDEKKKDSSEKICNIFCLDVR